MFISKHKGNIQQFGVSSGQIRNNYEIWENTNGYKFIKMDVLKNKKIFQVLFDFDDLEKVLNNSKTWYIQQNGYVAKSNPSIYLHHLIMNFNGNGKGFQDFSIDHINRSPLDNRKINLRLATPLEQIKNSKGHIDGTKKARQKNAKPLPNGLKQEDIPKYIVYYNEIYGSEKKIREFFRIEKHPLQICSDPIFKNKWTTSKSMKKFTIQQKLAEAKSKLEEMNNFLRIITLK